MSPRIRLAVIGDGAVGLLAALSARSLGAEQIILMGRHADRASSIEPGKVFDAVTGIDGALAGYQDMAESQGPQGLHPALTVGGVRRLAIVMTISAARTMSRVALAGALPRRWAHVQGVARQAERVAVSLALDPAVLVTAAWVHDVGYAPDLAKTGFHPLDGARYLSVSGMPTRIVNLVARHSNAILEAELRGLADLLSVFPDECGPLRDATWYCDLTTSPDGMEVSAPDRIAEIKSRYGPGHVVTQFISDGAADLLAAVGRTQQRLGQS